MFARTSNSMLISTSVAIAERNSQRGFYILRQISHLTNDLIISLALDKSVQQQHFSIQQFYFSGNL